MAIRYNCPDCREPLSIGTHKGGAPTVCPACHSAHIVPPAPASAVGAAARARSPRPLDDDEEDEGLVLGRVERQSDELDLIPMVDCVFLLLVFYMITASYALQKTMEFAPPSPEKQGVVQAPTSATDVAKSSIIVQIDENNRILVDDTPVPRAADVADVLRAKMNGEQKDELVIQADPRAFHETEVAVVDAAKDLHFEHVRMAAPPGMAD